MGKLFFCVQQERKKAEWYLKKVNIYNLFSKSTDTEAVFTETGIKA